MINYTPLVGHNFIATSASFDDLVVYRVIDRNENQARTEVCYLDRKDNQLKSKYLDEIEGPFFPLLWGNRKVQDLGGMISAYNSIIDDLEQILLRERNNSVEIDVAINRLISMHLRDRNETILLLKVLIAENIIIEYKELSSGNYIRFTELKRKAEHSKQYYTSLANEISVKSDRVDLLISHGQTVGNFREFILRELLKTHLPSKFAVATGFIEDISKQLDIIVYDAHNFYPTFKEGDLVVVRREAVRAIIEVKSTLDTTNLKEALDSFYDILRPGLFHPEIPLFKGIFAFDTIYKSTQSIADLVKDFYIKPRFVEQLNREVARDIHYLYQEISCISIAKKHFLYTAYQGTTNDPSSNMVPCLCSISDARSEDIQTSMFLAMLFNYLDVDYYAKKTVSRAFSKVYGAETTEVVTLAKLGTDTWMPSVRRDGQHDGTVAGVRERIQKVNKWLDGETTTTEYLKEIEEAKKATRTGI